MTTIPNPAPHLLGVAVAALLKLMEERPDEGFTDEDDGEEHPLKPVRVEDMRERAALAKYPMGSKPSKWGGKVKRTYRKPVDLSKRRVGIGLHSNGVTRPESSPRWHLTTAHWQATHERALWLHPHSTYLIAANMLDVMPLHAINIESIGKGGDAPVSDAVIETTRECIRQIVQIQAAINQPVEWIAPHRVGALSGSRPACPGGPIWRECGEWAAREFGLAVPPDHALWPGCGVIPAKWHGQYWRGGEGLARLAL